MAYEMREGSGSLFRNDKDGNEKRPDYRGDALINGEVLEISAWIKEGKNGKFMSLSFKPKEAKATKPAPTQQRGGGVGDMEDIPFIRRGFGRSAYVE
jgi:hypothetical protein